MKTEYIIENRQKNVKRLFFILMIFLLGASLIYSSNISGDNIRELLFFDGAGDYKDNVSDTFMDFYNPLYHTAEANPYTSVDRIYPALPYVFYYIITLFIPHQVSIISGKAISISQSGQFMFLLYTIITSIALFAVLWKFYQGKSNKEKLLTIGLLIFSAPFLFQFERANIILVSLIFLILFFLLKDSDKPRLREVALICLAISACIKIYPAIFGLILLKEKRFKEAGRCILYGILLFVIPFLFMGGLDKIFVMLESLTKGAQDTVSVSRGLGYKVNISTVYAILCGLFGYLDESLIKTGNIIALIFLILSIVSAFFMKSKWKTVAILAAIMVAFPSFSFIYSLIFLSIPLIMLLTSEEQRTRIDYLYALLFVGIFGLIVFRKYGPLNALGGELEVNMSTFVEGVSLTSMLILLNIEGLKDMISKYSRKKKVYDEK